MAGFLATSHGLNFGPLKGALKFLFGEKPDVPELPMVNVDSEQQKALSGNLRSLPQAEKLGASVNTFNQDQLLKALEFAFPGARSQVQQNIMDQLQGKLSPDAGGQIWRNAVAGGFSRGLQGSKSQLGANFGARSLGIGAEQLKQQGFQNYLNFANLGVPKQQFDVSSMFFTPQQRVQTQIYQNEQQFNRNWLAQQVEAAPSPVGVFAQNFLISLAGGAGKAIGAAI